MFQCFLMLRLMTFDAVVMVLLMLIRLASIPAICGERRDFLSTAVDLIRAISISDLRYPLSRNLLAILHKAPSTSFGSLVMRLTLSIWE
ncbi:hypothetical protein FKM82_025765 [Ascaphus truei]